MRPATGIGSQRARARIGYAGRPRPPAPRTPRRPDQLVLVNFWVINHPHNWGLLDTSPTILGAIMVRVQKKMVNKASTISVQKNMWFCFCWTNNHPRIPPPAPHSSKCRRLKEKPFGKWCPHQGAAWWRPSPNMLTKWACMTGCSWRPTGRLKRWTSEQVGGWIGQKHQQSKGQ